MNIDIKTYIESGILELYVAGSLTQKENEDVYNMMLKHPEIIQEVIFIETSIVKLTAALSPSNTQKLLSIIKNKLFNSNFNNTSKVIPITKSKINWLSYTGWAAAILLAVGVFSILNQNKELENQIKVVESNKIILEEQIEIANTNLIDAKQLVNVLTDNDVVSVVLGGQAISPEAYAKVYWDKKNNSIYLDAKGLPKPPQGKVYQVWSLTLNPLTPTDLGTIDDFTTDDNKIFAIENINESQAFGITLEPAGGSKSPTLEQLYTLGVVSAAAP